MEKDKKFPEFNSPELSGVIGLASPKDRLAAYVLDCVLLLPVVQIFQAPFRKGIFEALLVQNSEQVSLLRLYNVAIFVMLFVVYYSIMTYWRGQTLGKMFFKVKVISYHGSLSFLQSFLRSFSIFLEFLCLGLPFVDLFHHSMRRPIHDRVADTLVISLKSPIGFPTAKEKFRAKLVGAAFALVFSIYLASTFLAEDRPKLSAAALLLGKEHCEKTIEKYDGNLESLSAVFLDRGISSTCLHDEARDQLWKSEKSAVAKFALFLALKDKPQMSNEYLVDVCSGEPDHPLCDVSRWLMISTVTNDFDIEQLYNVLKEDNRSPLAKILLARFLIEENRFDQTLLIVKSFQPPKAFVPLYSALSFQALLGTLNWSEARWIYSTQPHIDDEDLITFIYWDNETEKFSIKQKMELLELFHPQLNSDLTSGRQPAAVNGGMDPDVKEVYEYLEGQL